MRNPAVMRKCGSCSCTPRKSVGSGRIRSWKEGGSGITSFKSGYNMVDNVSEAMVYFSEFKKVKKNVVMNWIQIRYRSSSIVIKWMMRY